MADADIGLIGLAVMGQNLVMNMNDHGYTVAVYNRTAAKVDEFLNGPAKGSKVIGTTTIEDFIASLKSPRRVMMMVKAGSAVDELIEQLLPHLSKGDIIIDGGNALYTDSNRRTESLKEKGILFLGTGISGGEEGARFGPSIMPGGNSAAWPHVQNIFQDISAKADGDACCEWVGEQGAGHYVKMVHNGIEYGDMQQICEAYQLMKVGLGMSHAEMKSVFEEWNKGDLDSYLIEITADIMAVMDSDGTPLVEKVLDTAGQKGTGKWTGINALDLGIPLTLIGEAVFARCLSSFKDQRVNASKRFSGPTATFTGDKAAMVKAIKDALYASKIVSYAQGYMLMQEAAREYGWKLNYSGIAMMWRGGCIIRSRFLGEIKKAFDAQPDLENLLLADFFTNAVQNAAAGWRKAVALGVELGVSMPCLSSALAFYDGYRTETLSANLLQAQRDYFGSHTYERTDKPRGQFFHTDWIKLSKNA